MFAEVLRNDDGGEVMWMSVGCMPCRNVVDDSDGADKHVEKSFLQRKGSKSRFEPYELETRTRTAHGEANIKEYIISPCLSLDFMMVKCRMLEGWLSR